MMRPQGKRPTPQSNSGQSTDSVGATDDKCIRRNAYSRGRGCYEEPKRRFSTGWSVKRVYRQEDLMALPHPDEEALPTKEPMDKRVEELGKLLADYAEQPGASFLSFAI